MLVGTVEAEVSLARMGVPIVRKVVPQKNNPFFWELPKLIFTLFILGAKKVERLPKNACARAWGGVIWTTPIKGFFSGTSSFSVQKGVKWASGKRTGKTFELQKRK